MALARARRNESGFNYWPGFVDALSTLVLSIVFLLSVFLVVQFFLSQEVTGKDKALEQLNAKIAQLNDLLSLEKLGKINLDDQLAQLRAGLSSAEGERDRLRIVGLAHRVQHLPRTLSEFSARPRAIPGTRPDIRVVGDRFVFQSEVFFDTGQAQLLPEGRAEPDKPATALIDLDKQIPAEIAWVLRVDGHTDVRPILNSPAFKSNWELSSARAISVVQYLVSLGVPAQRLVAAGFAEFQPLDTAPTEEAYKRNRRIELKLTER